jgi:hypothetical protein
MSGMLDDVPPAMRRGYPKFRERPRRPGNLYRREGVRVHRHVPAAGPPAHINMGAADAILCPYCATRFRFDSRLAPFDAEPPDSFFA